MFGIGGYLLSTEFLAMIASLVSALLNLLVSALLGVPLV